MNNSFLSFLVVTILPVFIAILIVLWLSLKGTFDLKMKNIGKSEYVINRNVSVQMKKKEETSMRALDNGEIKCHLIQNSANTHDVGGWVTDMRKFMKKPICQQLLLLEGNHIDE